MATTIANIPYDRAYLKEFARIDPRYTYTEDQIADGTVITSSVFEALLAREGGLTRSSAKGEDFTDGSDAKLGTVTNTRTADNPYYQVQIANLECKCGALRIVSYDPRFGKFWYF